MSDLDPQMYIEGYISADSYRNCPICFMKGHKPIYFLKFILKIYTSFLVIGSDSVQI